MEKQSQPDLEQNEQDQPTRELTNSLQQKLDYLSTLRQAISAGDDRLIYELIDGDHYHQALLNEEPNPARNTQVNLITDVHPAISHYLSTKLIDYLAHEYPFFYYEETQLGEFQIYFGNWWDRRRFGKLNALKVAFEFSQEEFNKLQKTFELAASHKRFNTDAIQRISAANDQLQALIDAQGDRDQQKDKLRQQLKENGQRNSLFDSGRIKDERQQIIDQLTKLADQDEQANNAHATMKDNEAKILTLSKEDTILAYEKQAIEKSFKSFENFNERNRSLYVDYLTTLIGKAQVDADDE
ncbi:exonuclease SbcC [Lactiplantibacillus dongliensis]|uniref:Exonuclease SbcC n=1 Tax=Lactiplantibacillus dongliensis TaxID=2559919 RepID=A0ABW1R7M1_9LACO|nr:exonuclease SbcC [Lactiplantibacillus dongliensis]